MKWNSGAVGAHVPGLQHAESGPTSPSKPLSVVSAHGRETLGTLRRIGLPGGYGDGSTRSFRAFEPDASSLPDLQHAEGPIGVQRVHLRRASDDSNPGCLTVPGLNRPGSTRQQRVYPTQAVVRPRVLAGCATSRQSPCSSRPDRRGADHGRPRHAPHGQYPNAPLYAWSRPD